MRVCRIELQCRNDDCRRLRSRRLRSRRLGPRLPGMAKLGLPRQRFVKQSDQEIRKHGDQKHPEGKTALSSSRCGCRKTEANTSVKAGAPCSKWPAALIERTGKESAV